MEKLPPGCLLDFDTVVSREKWNAQDPLRYGRKLREVISQVIFTYTGTEPCNDPEACKKAVQDLQRFHMRYHLQDDIPYGFVLGGDGRIYYGRGWLWSVPMPPGQEENYKVTLVVSRIGAAQEDPKKQLEDFRQGYNLLHFGIWNKMVTPDFKIITMLEDWNTYDGIPD